MAMSVRIKIEHDGIRELLHSAPLREDLQRRMRPVLQEAQASHDHGDDAEYELTTVEHPTRTVARVTVTGSRALYLESQSGSLARALHRAGGA